MENEPSLWKDLKPQGNKISLSLQIAPDLIKASTDREKTTKTINNQLIAPKIQNIAGATLHSLKITWE